MELINEKIKNELRYKTIYDLIFKQKNILIEIFLMGFAVILLAVSANITIPLWPVPITMQTFGIFLIAFFFGSRKGALTIMLYITAGLLGLGVFAGHKSGVTAVLGPTGGYILGFLIAVYAIGLMIEKGYGRTKSSVLLCMIIGNLIIYAFGLVGLWVFFGNVGLLKILTMGLFPFLIGDAIKIAAAIALFPFLWNASQKFYLSKN